MLFNEAKNNLNFDNCYKIGKIFKPHANKGQVSAKIFVALEILKLESVFVEMNKNLIPFFIDYSMSSFNNASAIIKFIGIDNMESSKIFSSNNVYFPKIQLPDIEDFLTDFENFIIEYLLYTSDNKLVGKILEFIDDNKNPLFVVEYKNADVLLPIFSIEIIEADFQNQKIIANIPQSLLEL
ncbi:MAG: hypothetical protein JXR68_05745 [Bacteroidales bacterium]|nr:hypothetical protein [Bacteroidales bacterium]